MAVYAARAVDTGRMQGRDQTFCIGANLGFSNVGVRTVNGVWSCHPPENFETAICVLAHFVHHASESRIHRREFQTAQL